MVPIPADQKRAISDYRCSSRKLVRLLRLKGRDELADEAEAFMGQVTVVMAQITEEVDAEDRKVG